MIAVEATPHADAPTVDAIVVWVWGILHTAVLSDSYRAALVAALALPGNILADTPDGRWACIVQTCCVTAGGRGEDAIPAAAAAELFMVALDVLDDEEDGEATPLRAAWGAARALNVSTGLLFLAQRALLAAPSGALLLGIVLDAGIHACAGQHADLAPAAEHGGDPTSALSVAKGKSASLVAALCQVGAACAEADAGTQGLYACFGASLGMTLQLRNDIAAARPGATQKTGIALGRPTLPLAAASRMDVARTGGVDGLRAALQTGEPALLTWTISELYRRHASDLVPALSADPDDRAALARLLRRCEG